MFLQPLIAVLLLLAALIAQSVYYLKDRKEYDIAKPESPYSKLWHFAGGAIHIMTGLLIGKIYGWQWGLTMGSLTWLLFDGAINSFYLQKEFFYVGTTAFVDRGQKLIAKILFGIDVRLLSGLLKVVLLLTSILLLFKKYR